MSTRNKFSSNVVNTSFVEATPTAPIFLALVLDKIRETSPKACAALVFGWIGFYSCTAYAHYSNEGFVDGLRVVRLAEHPLRPVIRFFRSKNVKTIYTSTHYSSAISFLSGGELVGTEYQISTRGKKKKALSAVDPNFVVLINEEQIDDIRKFQAIAKKNDIVYQTERIETFLVFLEFAGNTGAIDKLRSFTDWWGRENCGIENIDFWFDYLDNNYAFRDQQLGKFFI